MVTHSVYPRCAGARIRGCPASPAPRGSTAGPSACCRPAAPRRHRGHRPRRPGPGRRRLAGRRRGRGGRQRQPVASPAATRTSGPRCWSTPASRCSTTSARASSSGVKDGDTVRLDGDTVYARRRALVANGRLQDAETVARSRWPTPGRACRPSWRRSPPTRWSTSAGARPAARRRRRARDPDRDRAAGTCWSSSAATTTSADLDVLRPYIREFKPVLIGVDGGADALVEAGYTPDIDRRRHGLGLRRRAALRRRGGRARLPGRAGARPGPGARTRRRTRSPSRPPAPARTSRCCSPTSRAPR